MSRTLARSLCALALVVAPAVTTVAVAVDVTPQADTTEELLTLVAASPGSWSAALMLFLLSGLLWVPAGIALLRLFGRPRPLGWWAGAAVLIGGVAIVPLDTAGLYLSRVATSGVPIAEQVELVEAVEASPTLIAFEVLHVVGLFVGLLVVAVALFRTRLVPPWAAAGILLGLVTLVAAPQQAVQTAAMAVVTVALGAVAVRVARMTDDEWQSGAAQTAVPALA